MNWQGIRDMVVQRLAEYQAGAAENDTGASIAPNTLYGRIGKSYKRMVDKIAARDPDKVTSLNTFTYPNQAESMALPAALQYRDIFSLERLATSTDYEPINPLSSWAEQQARIESQWLVAVDVPVQTTYGYRIEANLIYLYPKPSQDLTVRARFFAAILDITSADAAGFPIYIPDEFHDVIALMTAIALRSETASVPADLRAEYNERWTEYQAWASQRPKKTSLRFVHERD